MKTINNRKSELLKRFMTVQQCVGDDIDPTKHKVMTEQAILNIDAATMGEVKKEVKKLLDCSEGAAFTAQELEQMLLETAAMCIQQGKTARDNAAAATTAFLAQITHRTRRYLVPFALLGLRLGHLPPDMSSLRIGVCELCADIKCLKDIFAAIKVRVIRQARGWRHALPRKGTLVVPSGTTIAVVDVTTSSRYAPIEAVARLEEAYGFFVLYYDAIATEEDPSGAMTRMPLVSWQYRPALAPICRVAAEPIEFDPLLRFGTGFDFLWHRGMTST